MTRYRSILSHTVFSLQVLLLLILLFSNALFIPEWLVYAGQLHPLVVHFPIALLLFLIITLLWYSRWPNQAVLSTLFSFVLLHAVLFATLSALSGIILSTNGGYDALLLYRHQWLGAATAIFSYALWLVINRWGIDAIPSTSLAVFCGISLVAASHFGGSLTHGEQYLSFISEKDANIQKKPVTDSSIVYEAAIQPLLEARCYSCHNEKKAKGQLVMTSKELLIKGGKEGPAWISGDPANSRLIQRIKLDLGDKKHMPPDGKPQLSESEIELLHQWIARGASMEKIFMDYPPQDSFRVFAASFGLTTEELTENTQPYSFPLADPAAIKKLNNPYRQLTPKDNRSPALNLSFYIREQYTPEMLAACKTVKQQVISINLNKMPVEDGGLKEIAQFQNLEDLSLNGTKITGTTLGLLQACSLLKRISLANTKVKAEHLESLGKMPALEKVYVWQTAVTEADIIALKKKFPLVRWDRGNIPDTAEHLKLTTPFIKNPDKMIFGSGEALVLRHPMPGVSIRFTTDGTDPDSIASPVYSKPLIITGPTTVKARAVSAGWFSSDIKEFLVFARGIKPLSAVLFTAPDPKYKLQGGQSLIDGNKGESNNLLVNWLGFREVPFIAQIQFSDSQKISRVILSMADNTSSYIFPPVSIIILAGNDSTNMTNVGKLILQQPQKNRPPGNKAYTVPIKAGNYKYIRVEARPVPSLPTWHSGKKQKAWIFVDEVFFD